MVPATVCVENYRNKSIEIMNLSVRSERSWFEYLMFNRRFVVFCQNKQLNENASSLKDAAQSSLSVRWNVPS